MWMKRVSLYSFLWISDCNFFSLCLKAFRVMSFLLLSAFEISVTLSWLKKKKDFSFQMFERCQPESNYTVHNCISSLYIYFSPLA